jgi:hypothetical protein
MSFDRRFEHRWKNVIAPGALDAGLQAFRVDIPKASSSIPADILAGIARSRLILADITPLDGHRNGNVMYEVGIAHATRQPEEVLLFRSDTDRLLFDVSTIRVNQYAPDEDSAGARVTVADAIQWALREVDTLRALAVQNAAAALDYQATVMLMRCVDSEGLKPLMVVSMRDALGATIWAPALSRLLELGLAQTDWREMTEEEVGSSRPWNQAAGDLARYRLTAFGRSVLTYIATGWAPGGEAGLRRIAQAEEERRRQEGGPDGPKG